MQERIYLTTPLYYVNDKPHLGSAYTTLACDALARYQRLKGEAVIFITGCDEHGQKIQRTAEAAGLIHQGGGAAGTGEGDHEQASAQGESGGQIQRALEHLAIADRASGAAVLLEGAQGSMLDIDHGTYPFVTSSNTTVGGAATGVGSSPMSLQCALGVVKAYTTRVGHGPLPTEFAEPLQTQVRTLGHEFGATTGRARRCGWFDGVVVRYAARVNGLTALAITKLDVLDTLDELLVCTGYRINGVVHTEFPADLQLLEHAEPVYETMPGWNQSTQDARKLEDLPAAARAYLDRLEALCETPIAYVSVGTRRDQIIGVHAVVA